MRDWQLLTLAQTALRKCEHNPNATIDMTRWLDVMKSGNFITCLAGAYALEKYEFRLPGSYEPHEFPTIEEALRKLDDYRVQFGEYDGPNGEFHKALTLTIERGKNMIIEKVCHITDNLTDVQKATLAAELINDLNPNETCLKSFFDTLDDTPHNEIITRAAGRDER